MVPLTYAGGHRFNLGCKVAREDCPVLYLRTRFEDQVEP